MSCLTLRIIACGLLGLALSLDGIRADEKSSPAPEKNNADLTIIVRFEEGITLDQVKAKLETVGAVFVEVLSAERNTHSAKTRTPEERDKAIKALKEDKQVIFAEREMVYTNMLSRRSTGKSRAPVNPKKDAAASSPSPTPTPTE